MESLGHPLRRNCQKCGCGFGRMETKSGQDCIYCRDCGTFQYNAPKAETGRAVRTVAGIHAGITAAKRARVMERACGRCEMCGAFGEGITFHTAHFLSVADGLGLFGLTEFELNDEENLFAACETCNLGQGRHSVPPRFYAFLLLRRTRHS